MKGVTLVVFAIVAVVVIFVGVIGYILIDSFGGDDSDGETPIEDQGGEIPFQEEINRAIGENNVEICDEIGGSQKQVCIDNYYFNQFKLTGDVSNCDKIQNSLMKVNCKSWDDDKFNEAIVNNDSSICEEITSQEKKQACLDRPNNDNSERPTLTEGQVPQSILPGGGAIGQ